MKTGCCVLLIALSLPAFSAQAPVVEEAGPSLDPAISADGRSFAFASDRDGSGFLHLWVKPLPGGDGRRLTSGLHDDHEPVFSPDGRMLAYRSEVNGGGIYLIPATGGKPRLFAKGGHRPRFSPDGHRVAYWTGTGLLIGAVPGGPARPFHGEFRSAKDPVWSPDGKYMIFAGCRETSAESCDWWVSGADNGDATATGAAKFFKQQHLDGLPSPDLWLASNAIVFAGKAGESTRLWTLSLGQASRRAEAAPHRLTEGENDERAPSAASDGRILFASRTQNIDIWSLPFDANSAVPKGRLARVTSDASIDQRPSLSRDGKRIAWETSRGGNFEVWVKDLVSGKEHGITSGPLREHMPALSPDGSKLVYDAHDGEKVMIFEAKFEGGDPVKIREENVGQGSFQWTEKNGAVLYFHREPPGSVGLMDLSSKQFTVLIRHPKLNLSLADARLSPDGQWIAFPVPFAPHRSRLAIARVSGKVIDNEQDWTYVAPDTINSFQPEWSPNGKWLYFLSDQNGGLGVWAQHLSADMKPQGKPKSVLDFAGVRLTIAEMRPRDIGLTVAKDKLALAVAEYSGTIQSMRP